MSICAGVSMISFLMACGDHSVYRKCGEISWRRKIALFPPVSTWLCTRACTGIELAKLLVAMNSWISFLQLFSLVLPTPTIFSSLLVHSDFFHFQLPQIALVFIKLQLDFILSSSQIGCAGNLGVVEKRGVQRFGWLEQGHLVWDVNDLEYVKSRLIYKVLRSLRSLLVLPPLCTLLCLSHSTPCVKVRASFQSQVQDLVLWNWGVVLGCLLEFLILILWIMILKMCTW